MSGPELQLPVHGGCNCRSCTRPNIPRCPRCGEEDREALLVVALDNQHVVSEINDIRQVRHFDVHVCVHCQDELAATGPRYDRNNGLTHTPYGPLRLSDLQEYVICRTPGNTFFIHHATFT